MLTRTQRTETIASLEQELTGATGIYMTDFNNITVEKITQLRSDLRKVGVKYIVVKNHLAKIAMERCGLTSLHSFLKGPTGMVVTKTDSICPAKVLKDFKKKNANLLAIKGAYVDGAVFSADDSLKLADLPSREALLSQLLSVWSAPMSNFAAAMSSLLSKFALTLEAVKEQKAKSESEQK